jgi:hypothetical protein
MFHRVHLSATSNSPSRRHRTWGAHRGGETMRPEILSWLRLLAFAAIVVALVGGLVALTDPVMQLVALR